MYTARASGGFSLLETLIAFSIASLALGVIFQIYAKGTTATVLAGDYAQAVAIAESRLAEIGLENESETATFGEAGGKYAWEVRVTDYSDDSPAAIDSPMDLLGVGVEVKWQERGKIRSVLLRTVKPAARPPVYK